MEKGSWKVINDMKNNIIYPKKIVDADDTYVLDEKPSEESSESNEGYFVGNIANAIQGLDGPSSISQQEPSKEPSKKPKRNIFSADPKKRHPEAYDFGENLLGR